MRTLVSVCRAALAAAVLLGCGGDAGEAPQTDEPAVALSGEQVFWNELQELCDSAYEGAVIEAPAGDTTFAGKRLVMHVRTCTADEVRIPFHVGDDRSRTWVITRTDRGLQLKHDHRHEDGAEDEVTQYGGVARAGGTAAAQEFPADSFTSALIPAAATNVWTIELEPDGIFAYALRREGTARRFRIEFDLTTPVPAPPPPWGSER